jgi:cytochrome P450
MTFTGGQGGLLNHKGYEAMVHRAPNSFTMRGGKEHIRGRRIIAEGLSDKSLRMYEPRILEHINKF